MKKFITLTACLLCALTVRAQWGSKKVKGNGNVTTENRTLGNYDGVAVAGFFDVELVSGTEGKLNLKGEENLLEYIETEIKDNVLKIKVRKGYNLRPSFNKTILITVPFKDISSVSLAGSGDVVSKAPIKADNFETKLAGSGDIILDVTAENVEASVAGSGDLRLKGKANNFEVKVAGSGDIYAFDLKAQNVEASVAGSGDVRVSCSGDLKARVSGSGDITYKGNPTRSDTKVSGSGDVSRG
jgi:hypothetical protein